MNNFDLVVLGGGPAGYLAAERAAAEGLKTVLVEKRSLGGTCLNEGCIPTKTLLYSAKQYDGALHGEKYGVTATGVAIDHEKVIQRKDKVVKTLVSGVQATLKSKGVTVVKGDGVITGRKGTDYSVAADGQTYHAPRLLIATGSGPAVPPIKGLKEGLESGFVLTNRELLDLKTKPESLVVIGGGVIGLEMASYFCSIGTKVTIIEMLDHIAGENDPELVQRLQKLCEGRGMTFHLSAKVTEVTANGVAYEKDGKAQLAEAQAALLSIGRRANTAGIGLEAIDVFTERGAIITDEHMKTNQPGVYAAGDVNGKSMLAHTAYREAEVAVATMLGKKDVMSYNAIPAVLYTNPELASVGETEASAKAKGLAVDVVKLPMSYSGRYLAENEGGNGIFKLIVDKHRKTILGAQALSNYSSEFIVAVGSFIAKELTVADVKKLVFPHPTVAEIIREAVWQF